MWAPERMLRPNDLDILLQRGGRDHLRGLEQAGVDDFEAGVSQCTHQHLGAPVVTVQTLVSRSGHESADG